MGEREPADTRHQPAARVLILGVGNVLMGDDGVGPRAVEVLRAGELPEGVEVLDGATAGADLIAEICGREKLVVIDAMESGDPPGTVRRLEGKDLDPDSSESLSLHDLNLEEVLRMARLLRDEPREVVVLGVRVGRLEPGIGLSPEVEAALDGLVARALAEVV